MTTKHRGVGSRPWRSGGAHSMMVHQNDRETLRARAFRERLLQPHPPALPAWCVYCGVRPPTIRCGGEHTAYVGEWLCDRCYGRLFEGPVLCPQEGPQRHEGGERDGRRA
jgi:hypothetical protein